MLLVVVFAATFAATIGAPAVAGPPAPTCTAGAEIKLPGALDTSFGAALALSGDSLAIAATRADTVEFGEAGAVHLYRRDPSGQWQFEQTLESPQPGIFRNFGSSIGLLGEYLVVGDPKSGESPFATRGAVHFYRHQNGLWSLQDSFEGEASNDALGTSVAIDLAVPANAPGGDGPIYTAVAGAPRQDWGAENHRNFGAAYVFELRADLPEAGWASTLKLCRTPIDDEWCLADPAIQQSDQWGSAVTVAGEFMPIGATEGTSVDGGKARLMRRANSTGTFYAWASDGVFESDEPRAHEHFGGPLAVARNGVIAVGRSPGWLSFGDVQSAKAYIYRAAIAAPPAVEAVFDLGGDEDRFGSAVAVKRDTGSVVMIGDDGAARSRPGRVFAMGPGASQASWLQRKTIAASDGVNEDLFGSALALEGDWIAVGAPGADAVYLMMYCDPVFPSGGFEAPAP
jgi:hypothetical protein